MIRFPRQSIRYSGRNLTHPSSIESSAIIRPVRNYTLNYYERSELLNDGDKKKKYVRRRRPRRCNYWPIISLKTTVHVQSFPSILAPEILPASDSELRPRRSSRVRLAYTDPSGERQRAPSTLQQWGPPSLRRSFWGATASRPRRSSGVLLAYRDPSGER